MNHDPIIQGAFERMKADAYQVDAGPAFRAITQGGRQEREWGWIPVFAAVLLVPVVVASFGWYSDRGTPPAQGDPSVSSTSTTTVTTIATPAPSEFDAVFPPLYLTYLNQVRLLQNWRRSCFLELGWDGPEPTSGFGMRIRSIEEAEFRGFRGLYVPLKNGDPTTLFPESDSSVASLEAACDEVIGRVVGVTVAGDEGFLDRAQKLSNVIVSDQAVAHAETAFLACMADLGFDLPVEEGWAGAPSLVLEQLTYDSQLAVIAGRTPREYLWNPGEQIRLEEFLGEEAFGLGTAYEQSVAGAEAECFEHFLPIFNQRTFELFEVAMDEYRTSVESAQELNAFPPGYYGWLNDMALYDSWTRSCVALLTDASLSPEDGLPVGFPTRPAAEAEEEGYKGLMYVPWDDSFLSTLLLPLSEGQFSAEVTECDNLLDSAIGTRPFGDEGAVSRAIGLSQYLSTQSEVAEAETEYLYCMSQRGMGIQSWTQAPGRVALQLRWDVATAVEAGRVARDFPGDGPTEIDLKGFLGAEAQANGEAFERQMARAESECFEEFVPDIDEALQEFLIAALASADEPGRTALGHPTLMVGFVGARCLLDLDLAPVVEPPFEFLFLDGPDMEARPSLGLIDKAVAASVGYGTFIDRPEGRTHDDPIRLAIVECNEWLSETELGSGYSMVVKKALEDPDVIGSLDKVEACMLEAGFPTYSRSHSGWLVVFDWMIENVPGPTSGSGTEEDPFEEGPIPIEVLEAGRAFEASVATAEVECVAPFVVAFNASEAATDAWRIAP